MSDFPKISVMTASPGARCDHNYGQCFTMEYDQQEGKVRFTASGTSSYIAEGEDPMNGVLLLDVEEARAFLSTALAQLPEKTMTEVLVITDGEGSNWVEVEPNKFRGIWWHRYSVQAAYEYQGGNLKDLREILTQYGIRSTRTELV